MFRGTTFWGMCLFDEIFFSLNVSYFERKNQISAVKAWKVLEISIYVSRGEVQWRFSTECVCLSIIFVNWVIFLRPAETFRRNFRNCLLLVQSKNFEVQFSIWKHYINLFFISFGPWAKFLYFWRHFFPMYVKFYLFVSGAKVLENKDFLKKLNVLKLLGTWAMVFGLAAILWQGFHDCILRVHEKFFRLSSKNWFYRPFQFLNDFSSNSFSFFKSRVVKGVFMVCRETFSCGRTSKKMF